MLSELISAEHSDQCWTDLSGPLLSPIPANLAGEGGKLTLISADQNCALADQRWSEHVGESKDLPVADDLLGIDLSLGPSI